MVCTVTGYSRPLCQLDSLTSTRSSTQDRPFHNWNSVVHSFSGFVELPIIHLYPFVDSPSCQVVIDPFICSFILWFVLAVNCPFIRVYIMVYIYIYITSISMCIYIYVHIYVDIHTSATTRIYIYIHIHIIPPTSTDLENFPCLEENSPVYQPQKMAGSSW